MPYDKSKEKILHTVRIPDDEANPGGGGTIIKAMQYSTFKPKINLERWYTDKSGQEKVVSFVTIPSPVVQKVAETIKNLSDHIERKFAEQKAE